MYPLRSSDPRAARAEHNEQRRLAATPPSRLARSRYCSNRIPFASASCSAGAVYRRLSPPPQNAPVHGTPSCYLLDGSISHRTRIELALQDDSFPRFLCHNTKP